MMATLKESYSSEATASASAAACPNRNLIELFNREQIPTRLEGLVIGFGCSATTAASKTPSP
jgi:hypothetical protein